MKIFLKLLLLSCIFVSVLQHLKGQTPIDSLLVNASLNNCISYALKNQPYLQQIIVDKDIVERTIKSTLSGWLPQVRSEYNLQHYFKTPVSLIPNAADPGGPRIATSFVLPNVSNLLFQADQILFSSDIMLASKGAGYSKRQADQTIESNKIDVIINVSKAYYDVLLTEQQLHIFEEAIRRQKKLLDDSYCQYQVGLVDKLDYKRTTIALNNAFSDHKRVEESIKSKNTYLKQILGYPMNKNLSIAIDTVQINENASVDTNYIPRFENRIEYKQLQTQLQLQKLNVSYYKYSVLPTANAYINYNFYYVSQSMENLYKKNYPNSQAGLRLAMPIFQGGRRVQNLQRARLQVKRADLGIKWIESSFQSQYDLSLGAYKSSLINLKTQQENLNIAREVYEIVKLQYDQGIKPYLDVISAESDLRNSQINHYNALFNVLSSKLDLQRSSGTINTTSY